MHNKRIRDKEKKTLSKKFNFCGYITKCQKLQGQLKEFINQVKETKNKS